MLLWGAGAFARAPVGSVKTLVAWIAALAGLSLVAMLFLTGKGATALYALLLLGPLAWNQWQRVRGVGTAPPPRMARTDALEVLGLRPTASDSDIQAAWIRLMRLVHPDSGGTDWLAARVNQARDTLLARARR